MVSGRATALALVVVLMASPALAACEPSEVTPTAPPPEPSTSAAAPSPQTPPVTLPPLDLSAWWTAPAAGCGAGEVQMAAAPELAGLVVECQPADGSFRPRLVNVSDVSLSISFWDHAYDVGYEGPTAADDALTSDVLARTGTGYLELYRWEGPLEVGVSTLPAGDALSLTYMGAADGADHLVTVEPDAAHTRAAFAVRAVSGVFDDIPWGELGMDGVRWSRTVGCAGAAAVAIKNDYEMTLEEALDVSAPCRDAVGEIHERYRARRQAAVRRVPAQRLPAAMTPDDVRLRVTSATRPAQSVLDDAAELLVKGAVTVGSRGRLHP